MLEAFALAVMYFLYIRLPSQMLFFVLNYMFFCSFYTRVYIVNIKLDCPLFPFRAFRYIYRNFPLPHVCPQPPFPLFANLREPTASAPRGDTLGSRIDRDISLIMPPSFVRRLRNNMAQSDGTTVKLGAPRLAAVAARVPSLNRHIPYISAH